MCVFLPHFSKINNQLLGFAPLMQIKSYQFYQCATNACCGDRGTVVALDNISFLILLCLYCAFLCPVFFVVSCQLSGLKF